MWTRSFRENRTVGTKQTHILNYVSIFENKHFILKTTNLRIRDANMHTGCSI